MEEQLQTFSRGSSFNPAQIPSSSAGIDRNLSRLQRDQQDYLQMLKSRDQQRIEDAKRKQREIDDISKFSETLTETLVSEREAANEEEKARGIARAYQSGELDANSADFQAQEAELNADQQKAVNLSQGILEDTGSQTLAQQAKSMTGWEAYGFAIGMAQRGGSEYAAYMAQNKNTAVTLPDGTEKSLGSPNLKPEEFKYITNKLRSDYFKNYSSINPQLLNEYLFPQLRKVDEENALNYFDAENARIDADNKVEAADDVREGLLGQAPEKNAKYIMSILGKKITTAEMRKNFPLIINNLIANGAFKNPQDLQRALDTLSTLVPNPSGGKPIPLGKVLGYTATRLEEAVSRDDVADDDLDRRKQLDGVNEFLGQLVFEPGEKLRTRQNRRALKEETYRELEAAGFDTSDSAIRSAIDNHFKDLDTAEDRDVESDRKLLKARLTQGKMGTGPGVTRDFISTLHPDVQYEAAQMLGDPESGVAMSQSQKTEAKNRVEAVTNEITKYTSFDGKEKNSAWYDVERNVQSTFEAAYEAALAKDPTDIQNAIDIGIQAIEKFRDKHNADVKSGKPKSETAAYAKPDVSVDQAMADKWTQVRSWTSTNGGAAAYGRLVVPGTESDLAVLRQIRDTDNGNMPPELPAIYTLMAQYSIYTPREIADMQLRANGEGGLDKTEAEQEWDETLALDEDPALRRLWNLKPSLYKASRVIRRDQSSNTSDVLSIPGITDTLMTRLTKREFNTASDIVGSNESGEYGYDAVNQIGIKGGTATQGFSGRYSGLSGGKNLTDLSLGEVMELQARRPGMSNAEWIRQGRLHAVGKYQFIGDTLRGLVEKYNIDKSLPFNSSLQDMLFLALLKDPGVLSDRWIGLRKNSASDRAYLNQIRDLLNSPARSINAEGYVQPIPGTR